MRSWRLLAALTIGIAAFGTQTQRLHASSSPVLLGRADNPAAVGDFVNENNPSNVPPEQDAHQCLLQRIHCAAEVGRQLLGLNGAPTDSAGAASFTCSGAPIGAACQNATAFTALIGQLLGGQSGTISYTIALPSPPS